MLGGIGIVALCVGAFAVWEATEELHDLWRWLGRRIVRAPAMIAAASLWLAATILLFLLRLFGHRAPDQAGRRDSD